MQRLKQNLVVAAGLTVLGITGLFMNSTQVAAQNPHPGSAPVNIVSPLPLPVTGDIRIPDTVNVRDINHLAQTPFQAWLDTFDAGAQHSRSFVVPSDTKLTIEFVTADCTSNFLSPGTYFRLGITTSGVFATPQFAPKYLVNAGIYVYGSTDMTRLYADAGSTVSIQSQAPETNCSVTLSGYTTPN